jgi:hypothetical protein
MSFVDAPEIFSYCSASKRMDTSRAERRHAKYIHYNMQITQDVRLEDEKQHFLDNTENILKYIRDDSIMNILDHMVCSQ